MIYEVEYTEILPKTIEEFIHISNKLEISKNCFLYFHLDSNKLLQDYLFCKKVSDTYKINVNWVDFSKIIKSFDIFNEKTKITFDQFQVIRFLKEQYKTNLKKYLME